MAAHRHMGHPNVMVSLFRAKFTVCDLVIDYAPHGCRYRLEEYIIAFGVRLLYAYRVKMVWSGYANENLQLVIQVTY